MGKNHIFCGNGKEKVFANGGSIVNLSICLSDIPEEFVKKSEKNSKLYVNLELRERKEIGRYGDTHFIAVNQWKPGDTSSNSGVQSNGQSSGNPFGNNAEAKFGENSNTNKYNPADNFEDDIPF
jgi:hypothetical protein